MPDLLLCTAVSPGLQAAHARLLTGAGLRLEEAGECTALLLADDGALLACGTRSGKVLRQIAVSPEAEGGGACAEVVSALLQDATAHGVPHPFLFTAPGKSGLFRSLGFTPLEPDGFLAQKAGDTDPLLVLPRDELPPFAVRQLCLSPLSHC